MKLLPSSVKNRISNLSEKKRQSDILKIEAESNLQTLSRWFCTHWVTCSFAALCIFLYSYNHILKSKYEKAILQDEIKSLASELDKLRQNRKELEGKIQELIELKKSNKKKNEEYNKKLKELSSEELKAELDLKIRSLISKRKKNDL